MRILAVVSMVLFCVLLCAGARAQMQHDPLTSIEVDRMREAAQDPNRRIELLLGFAGERLMAVERLHSAATPERGDGARVETLLGEFAQLIDELDDNLAMYSKRQDDLRHPLRRVLDAEAGFQQKLEALAGRAPSIQLHDAEKRGLSAALEDASDSLQSSSKNAHAMLATEIQKRGEEKDKKKVDRSNLQSIKE